MPTTSRTRAFQPATWKTAGIGQHDELIDQQSDRPQRHSDKAEQRKPSELVVDKIRAAGAWRNRSSATARARASARAAR